MIYTPIVSYETHRIQIHMWLMQYNQVVFKLSQSDEDVARGKVGHQWVATDEMISLVLVRGIYYHEEGQAKKYNLLLLVAKQMVHENSKKDAISLCIISGSKIQCDIQPAI
jgi:hypothetical protein